MRTKILGVLATLGVVAGAVTIAWALWSASAPIHTSLEVSQPPEVNIAYSMCDDDGVLVQALWDGNDLGPDPAGPGPLSVRYDKDIASCTTSFASSEGTFAISAGYADLWTSAWFSIGNPGAAWDLTQVVLDGVNLANCPTMVGADISGDTALDVEACVSLMVGGESSATLPALGTTFEEGGGGYTLMLALHVPDTVTPGLTHVFDIVFVGESQTGGPE